MDVLFSQLSSQEAKSLFQELDGKSIVLWIWEKGESTKKIPIDSILKKDFSFISRDYLIPTNLKRASLLGTFEYKGFYYFLKLLSRELGDDVQFLCDPIIHKNERRKRKRFQISHKTNDFAVVIPLAGPPPLFEKENNVFSIFPVKLFKNFLTHITSISDGLPIYHLSFILYDISTSGLSMMADKIETAFLEETKIFPEVFLILNKEKLVLKNLEFVHKSLHEKLEEREIFRIGLKFECDSWTSKEIQKLLEIERENIVKEFDQWSKD